MRTKEEQREYQREWIKARRLNWIEANGPCKKCGSDKDLEIDHINPENKKYSIGSIWSRNEAFLSEELSKCQVLCHDCHLEKTRQYYYDNGRHGTYAMRNTWKCTCDECKEYVRNAKRKWRENKKQ